MTHTHTSQTSSRATRGSSQTPGRAARFFNATASSASRTRRFLAAAAALAATAFVVAPDASLAPSAYAVPAPIAPASAADYSASIAASIPAGETATVDSLVASQAWNGRFADLTFGTSFSSTAPAVSAPATLVFEQFAQNPEQLLSGGIGFSTTTLFNGGGVGGYNTGLYQRIVTGANQPFAFVLNDGAQVAIQNSLLRPVVADNARATGAWLLASDAFSLTGVSTAHTHVTFSDNSAIAIAITGPDAVANAFGGLISTTGPLDFATLCSLNFTSNIVQAGDASEFAAYAEARGGVIRTTATTVFDNVLDLSFASNTASTAGKVQSNVSGGVINSTSTLSIITSDWLAISSNTATATLGEADNLIETRAASAFGGAFNVNGAVSFGEITHFNVENNAATVVAQGVSAGYKTLSLNAAGGFINTKAGVSFTDIREATLSINKVSVTATSGISTGTDFTKSTATVSARGGLILAEGAPVNFSDIYTLTISGNNADATATITAATEASLVVSATGGAIDAPRGVTFDGLDFLSISGNFVNASGTLNGGTGIEISGGVSAEGGALRVVGSSIAFTNIEKLTVSSNKAIAAFAASTGDFPKDADGNTIKQQVSAKGGAIYLKDGSLTLNTGGNVSFSGNSVSASFGGTLYLDIDVTVVGAAAYIENGTFNLTAIKGTNVYFYDSIYLADTSSGTTDTTSLNVVNHGYVYLASVKSDVEDGQKVAVNVSGNGRTYIGDIFFDTTDGASAKVNITSGIVSAPSVAITYTDAGLTTPIPGGGGATAFAPISTDNQFTLGATAKLSISSNNGGSSPSASISVANGKTEGDTVGVKFEGGVILSFAINNSGGNGGNALLSVTSTRYEHNNFTNTYFLAPGIISGASTLIFDIANLDHSVTDYTTGTEKTLVVFDGYLGNSFDADRPGESYGAGGNYIVSALTLRGESLVNLPPSVNRAANLFYRDHDGNPSSPEIISGVYDSSAKTVTIEQKAVDNRVLTWKSGTSSVGILSNDGWTYFYDDQVVNTGGTLGLGENIRPENSSFLHGDVLNFVEASGSNTISLNAGGVGTAGVYFSGNAEYIFTNGYFDIAQSSLNGSVGASNKLILGGKATGVTKTDPDANLASTADDIVIPTTTSTRADAAFSGIVDISQTVGVNQFDGVEIYGGTLRIASWDNISNVGEIKFETASNYDFALTTLPAAGYANAYGKLEIKAGADFVLDAHYDPVSTRINLAAEKGAKISLAAGATFVVQHIDGTLITSHAGADLRFEGTGAGGSESILFAENLRRDINGINSRIVFQNLNSVAFVGNVLSTDTVGGTIYAGQLFFDSLGSVSFLDNRITASGDSKGGTIATHDALAFSNIGGVAFSNNTIENTGGNAAHGGAIYTTAIDLSFTNIGSVLFTRNSVLSNGTGENIGGAIFYNNDVGQLRFADVSDTVAFIGNKAAVYHEHNKDTGIGGAIYTNAKNTVFERLGTLVFSRNSAGEFGGAIAFSGDLFFQDITEGVLFENNKSAVGGAIASDTGTVATTTLRFDNIPVVSFTGNTAEVSTVDGVGDVAGGAIATETSLVTFSNISTGVSFTGNTAKIDFATGSSATGTATGGAIYATAHASLDPADTLKFANVATVVFSENKAISNGTNIKGTADATAIGGAFYARNAVFTDITTAVAFDSNTAAATINATNGTIEASARGGAFFAVPKFSGIAALNFNANSVAAIADNSKVTSAKGITATAQGGAIYIPTSLSEVPVAFFTNIAAPLAFTGQSAVAVGVSNGSSDVTVVSKGGAIYTENVKLTFSEIPALTFADNIASGTYTEKAIGAGTASAWGGAIYARGELTIEKISTVTFANNKAQVSTADKGYAYAGAIHFYAYAGASPRLSQLSFSEIDTLAFTGNRTAIVGTAGDGQNSQAWGGVICYDGNAPAVSTLSFTQIGTLVFSENSVSSLDKTGKGVGTVTGGALALSELSAVFNTGGDILFSKNSATGGDLNAGTGETYGGAIYANYSEVLFVIADGKTVLFTGNTSQKGLDPIRPDSIVTAGSNFDFRNDGTLDLRDPISGIGDASTFVHSGKGVWNLGGKNDFTQSAGGSFDIKGGTLHLYREGAVANATIANPDATVEVGRLLLGDGSFRVAHGATLSIGGGNELTTDGAVNFEDGSILHFDLLHKAPEFGKPLLTLNANGAAIGDKYVVDVNSLDIGDGILLASGLAAFGDPSLTLNGATLERDRRVSAYSLYIVDPTLSDPIGTLSIGKLPGDSLPNIDGLYWTGAEGNIWETISSANSAHNWSNTENTAAANITQFANGDSVVFPATAANKAVRVAQLGVIIGAHGARVETNATNDYSFEGGAISGVGGFLKRGEGTLTFKNANTFLGGVAVEDGKVIAQSKNAIGTGGLTLAPGTEFVADFTGAFNNNVTGVAATVTVTPTAAVTFNGDIEQPKLVNNGIVQLSELITLEGSSHITRSFRLAGVPNGLDLASTTDLARILAAASIVYETTIDGTLVTAPGSITHRFGPLENNGYLDFYHAGYVLAVDSLSGHGQIRLDVDLANPLNTDRLIVLGAFTGSQHFLLTDVTADPNTVTRNSGNDTVLVQAGDASAATVSGRLIAGAYTFDLIPDNTNGYRLHASTPFSPQAQAAIAFAATSTPAWFSQLDNLSKRSGDLRLSKALAADAAKDAEKKGNTTSAKKTAKLNNDLWFRAHGQRVNTDLGIEGVSDFSETQYGADVGYDHEFIFSDSSLYLGLFVGYQHAKRNFRDGYGSNGDTDTLTGGIYATWATNSGWYIDGVLKYQINDTEYTAATSKGETDGAAYGLSLEFGKRIEFAEKWFVEPSVQAAFLRAEGDNYALDNGLRIKTGDADIARFAANLRGGRSFEIAANSILTPYVKAGAETQFSYGGDTRIADLKVRPNTDGTRATVGIGAAWQVGSASQIWLEYEATFGDKYDRPWSINLGYRYRF